MICFKPLKRLDVFALLGSKNVRQMVLTIFEPLHNFLNFPHFPDIRQLFSALICYLYKNIFYDTCFAVLC